MSDIGKEIEQNPNPEFFRRLAVKVSIVVGSPKAFIFAIIFILTWFSLGTLFDYSNTWQLFINTITTICTFLMVILIQNTQNRDTKAIQIKLDELIKGVRGARNTMVNLEELPDSEIEELHVQFRNLHEKYQREHDRRKAKTK